MELPDCPPGTEGYQDSVTEVPKKLDLEESCTKAEQEFQEHLNSLKIKIDDGSTRCMVERRGRDISGKWIYLCYPCAAVCSGESILQTHISGKKHKAKLSLRNIWPMSIFDEHPFNQSHPKSGATEKILQKMAEEVTLHNSNADDLEVKYDKYKNADCHIQESLDGIKAPLVGVEYLIEHPPEQSHYEPSYMCTLCSKQGHPRTIVNHMTCFWHRYNYLVRHFAKACSRITPYRAQPKYREGVGIIMNRLAQRIEDKYGRMKPVHIDKEEYEKDKDNIHRWIYKSHHYSEKDGPSFEEVADIDLINSLFKSSTVENNLKVAAKSFEKRDPSPPVVAAPLKPQFSIVNRPAGRQQRRDASMESLSDISDDQEPRPNTHRQHNRPNYRDRQEPNHKPRFEPYNDKFLDHPSFRSKFALKNAQDKNKIVEKPRNHEYKVKLAEEKRQAAEESAKKTLAYHEKNPEKHPLYPEEWKKFWNRRYKEIQAEGKDPSKHDFKPEWIVFWTKRMKELHDDELRIHVNELYRKMCLSPPDMTRHSPEKRQSPETRKNSLELKRRSVEMKRRSLERRRSPYRRDRRTPDFRRSPPGRRPSPSGRRPSPPNRRPSPPGRRLSPPGRRSSPPGRRPSPPGRRPSPPVRRPSPPGRRPSPPGRRPSPPAQGRRQSPPRRRSPPRYKHTRSRSRSPHRSGVVKSRGVPIPEYQPRRSRSPLSRRDEALRNRSPHNQLNPHNPHHLHNPQNPQQEQVTPSMQTVLVSDDELKTDDISPWNSDNDIDSISSMIETRSRGAASAISRGSRTRNQYRENIRPADPQDLGPAENVIATLRMLVALEDYLGSLGPKVVDLLTEALKMEKEKANSSEDLLERESALVLIETSKEKLKGAAQAGLVAAAAAAAVRAAVVRAAATLHAADTRAKKIKQTSSTSRKPAPVPVAGVGEVDRAQIAQQMAAALIAQGKTDVSSEELAQLVDAVVGMAEAKKREAEVKKKVEARAASNNASRSVQATTTISGTASALQMLQSAYDENDKKVEKEDVPDAMDGLSDSDLETLLKNFNELSAEEQHSLIAYLKKLEAKEPQRVERLRQYVSSDATPAPQVEEPAPKEDVEPVTIESDDDDYAVEEVFISATQKVKENQIRQEMEIVKKSLEESKEAPPKEEEPKPESTTDSLVNLTKNLSSAANLLALVQASIQSTAAPTPSPITQTADVVTSSTQPRSFGDKPESPMPIATIQPIVQNAPIKQNPTSIVQSLLQSQALQNQQGGSQPFHGQQGGSQLFNNQQGGSQSLINQRVGSEPFKNQQGGSQSFPNQQGGSQPFTNQQGGSQSFNDQQGGSQPFTNQQGGSQPFTNQQGGSQSFTNQQGGSQPFGNQQGGSQPYNSQHGSQPFNNQTGGSQPYNSQHGSQPFNNQQGGSQPFNNQQGSQPYHNNQSGSQQFHDDTQDGSQQYYNEQQGGSQPFHKEQQGGMQPFQNNSQGGSQPFHNNQQGSQPFYNNQVGPQPFKNNQQGGLLRPQQNQMNFDGNRNNQNNQGPWNQRPMQANRGHPIRPAFDNHGRGGGQFNNQQGFNQQGQGPRGSFVNSAGRNQDNFNTRPQDMNRQNFNHNDNHHNPRGRGGGRGYGGQNRGRGRGYY